MLFSPIGCVRVHQRRVPLKEIVVSHIVHQVYWFLMTGAMTWATPVILSNQMMIPAWVAGKHWQDTAISAGCSDDAPLPAPDQPSPDRWDSLVSVDGYDYG